MPVDPDSASGNVDGEVADNGERLHARGYRADIERLREPNLAIVPLLQQGSHEPVLLEFCPAFVGNGEVTLSTVMRGVLVEVNDAAQVLK